MLKGFCGTNYDAYSLADLVNETGKLLNYDQLRRHPRYAETWNKSFSNEMGGSCQGVGTENNGFDKRVDGTNNFYVIQF